MIAENQGGAQLFGHNPTVQTFAGILAQRKAKQDQDNKYLAEQMASVKPDGLRNDADRQSFYNKYATIKQQGIDAANEKDPRKRTMAIANVRQSLMDLDSYVNQSKQQAAKENSYAQAYMQNPTAWSDESIDQHRKSSQMAVDNPNIVKDYTTLARKPDLIKLDTRLKNIRDDELLSGIKGEDVITGRKKVGNKWENQIQTKYTADPEDVHAAYLNEYDINDDFKHRLVSQYGHQIPQGLPPDQQKAALVGQYVRDLGEVSKYDKVKESVDRAPRATTNVYIGGQPQQMAIPAENPEGKQIGVFSSPNYLPMNKQNINMAGAKSINLQTLQPDQPLKSSNKYNLVGLTSAPVLNKDLYVGKKKIPKGSLSQGDYANSHPEDVTWQDMAHVQEDYPADDEHPKPYTIDHLVNANLLPHNVTGTKAWQAQVANYKPVKNTQQTAPTVKFNLNGQVYNIPSDKVGAFKRAKPNAKQLQ